MGKKLLATPIIIFTIILIALPAKATPPFITLTSYDGRYTTVIFAPTGEIVTIDVSTLGWVSPGPYPYTFNLAEPLHAYLQIRHFLWTMEEGVQNNLTIYLNDAPILEANALLPLPYWYPGGDGIDLIDLGTLQAGTYNITMSAALPDYYGMDWWKILTPTKIELHEVTVAGQTFYIATETNSTISNFAFDENFTINGWAGLISFDATGPPGTIGFCNVIIPTDLMKGPSWLILINRTSTPETFILDGNETHTFLYFTYRHNAHIEIMGIWVVLEFPTAILLPLLTIATIIAVILRKKIGQLKIEKQHRHHKQVYS